MRLYHVGTYHCDNNSTWSTHRYENHILCANLCQMMLLSWVPNHAATVCVGEDWGHCKLFGGGCVSVLVIWWSVGQQLWRLSDVRPGAPARGGQSMWRMCPVYSPSGLLQISNNLSNIKVIMFMILGIIEGGIFCWHHGGSWHRYNCRNPYRTCI